MEFKKEKKKAWDIFSKYIRTRDCLKTTGTKENGLCITCDRMYGFKELQAGHYIAGRTNAVLFDEIGVNAQCLSCNFFKHGDPLTYREKLIALYGLELKKGFGLKYSAFDMVCIQNIYKEKLKKLEENL